MLFIDEIIGKYVFSEEENKPEVLTAWKITDEFEDLGEYLVVENVSSGERKCCFVFYSLRIWDTSDPINYPLDEVKEGLAEIQNLNEVLKYKCELMEGELPYGWLSPTGEFFHCKFGGHIKMARIVLQSSEEMLENRGWVKVLYNEFLMKRGWLTPEQAQWLRRHNFNEEDINDISDF